MEVKSANQDMDEIIATCLSEGLDAKQTDELQQWINASSENRKHFKDLQEIWFASIAGQTGRFDKNEAYRRFLKRTNQHKAKKISLRPFLYAAAGVLLLLIISYASYWQGREQLKSRFADVVIEAPFGSKTKTYLPDGTLVWLNAGSKITYSQGFGVSERNVRLSGEGYFEVSKNEKVPFNVKTDELQVNVLGTIFNFKNYPDGEEATVSLVEGKVLAKNNLKNDDV
ncbi:MAG: FecR family protein, partial [Candidatus Symbiothrix sp.]|nr:FecR family protein [Candidatus Symbiothrix sp.]